MGRELVLLCKCDDCNHKWLSEVEHPKRCPRRDCRSLDWDIKAHPLLHGLSECEKNRIVANKTSRRNLKKAVQERKRLGICDFVTYTICQQHKKQEQNKREQERTSRWANVPQTFLT